MKITKSFAEELLAHIQWVSKNQPDQCIRSLAKVVCEELEGLILREEAIGKSVTPA